MRHGKKKVSLWLLYTHERQIQSDLLDIFMINIWKSEKQLKLRSSASLFPRYFLLWCVCVCVSLTQHCLSLHLQEVTLHTQPADPRSASHITTTSLNLKLMQSLHHQYNIIIPFLFGQISHYLATEIVIKIVIHCIELQHINHVTSCPNLLFLRRNKIKIVLSTLFITNLTARVVFCVYMQI